MMQYTVYVVDDEAALAEGIRMLLEGRHRVKTFTSAEPALKAMEEERPDLVLLDIGLPGMSGIEALERIRKKWPEILVVMITAYEDVSTVVSAMKQGAYDYVVKPIHMDTLEAGIDRALESIRLKKEVQTLQEKFLRENVPCFIGESKAIQDVMQFVETVAKSPDTPVLILGESGTGKELIAGAIHFRSPNFKGHLVPVNCAGIPKELMESELFGYEKGAFSGAKTSGKKGLVEEAAGGTLFLDEIGDLNFEAQAKLLRFLETGEFYRLGGSRKLQVRTRLVSATNKNLQAMIENGLFREDLYFRLGVVTVEIPSLDRRKEDIVPIARYFLLEFGKKFGKSFSGFDPEAEKLLERVHWRGNVRELRNTVEKTALIAPGPLISPQDLGLDQAAKSEERKPGTDGGVAPPLTEEGLDMASTLTRVEKTYILDALTLAGNNESRAARLLGMNYSTFRYRRKKLLNS